MYNISNYSIIRADRSGKSGHGGVVTYVRNDNDFCRMNISDNVDYEAIWIQIVFAGTRFQVANIYRPPSKNITDSSPRWKSPSLTVWKAPFWWAILTSVPELADPF
jgi:hypothetical protein